MTLPTDQQMLIEQQVANEAKSTGAAYLLWLFFGLIGGHRFYLGHIGSGLLMLFLFVVGWLTIAVAAGALALIPLVIWVLIDAFLIPGMVQKHKSRIRAQLTNQAMTIAKWPRRDA